MPPEDSFHALMGRLRGGDDRAADEVFRRFAGRLIALARGRLDPLMRRKVDPEDVLQSVFKSFFVRQAQGQWELTGWSSLWGLLTAMTIRKCVRRAVHFRAACRDVRRETNPQPRPEDSAPGWEALGREPTPDEVAVLAETLAGLLSGLSVRDREIVLLHLQGHPGLDIAAQAHCTERTVQRVLERLRGQLERQADEADKQDGAEGG